MDLFCSGMKKPLSFISIIMSALLLLAGCGGNLFENLSDNSSIESKVEQANIALDEGNYDEAISVLEELRTANPEDKQLTVDLATAHMGRAGLDAIKLMNTANKIIDTGGNNDSLKAFTDLFQFNDSVQTKDMHTAVDLIAAIPKAERSTSDSLLLAVAATSDIVLTLGVNITNGFDADGRPVIANLPAINEITAMTDAAASATDVGSGNDTVVERVGTDLTLVADGVTGSGLIGDELVKDINNIQAQIDPGTDGVSGADIHGYLSGL